MSDIIKGFEINSKGYGTVPKLIMQDRNLHICAKALYSYFCSYTGAGNTCFPTRDKICYDLCISIDTFTKYLNQLVKGGYIKVEQVKEKGRFAHNVYTLLEVILPCPKITVSGISVYGKTDTNNNSIKNNNINKINNNINTQKNSPPEQTVEQHTQQKKSNNKPNENQVKRKYGEYNNVLLSDIEYQKLVTEFPNDYQERIEILSEYIASTGKKYKNFLATIRSWSKREKTAAQQKNDKNSVNKDYSGGWD